MKSGLKIALFGNTSYDLIPGGTGSGSVNKEYVTNLAQGLTNAGYTADPTITSAYNSYLTAQKAKQPKTQMLLFTPPPIPDMDLGADIITTAASANDAAIITIGRNAGEGAPQDRKRLYPVAV